MPHKGAPDPYMKAAPQILTCVLVFLTWATGCQSSTTPAGETVDGDIDVLDVPQVGPDGSDVDSRLDMFETGDSGIPDESGVHEVCAPEKVPSCSWNENPVSCDLAVAYVMDERGVSPRATCETNCGHEAGVAWMNGSWCSTLQTGCWVLNDLECDACCTLSYLVPHPGPDDGDVCTEATCVGDACHHAIYAWVGQSCVRTADFGSCAGEYWCRNWCPIDEYGCFPGNQYCSAVEPGPDLPNGLDDDCDGETDEGPEEGVLRLSQDDGAADPSAIGLGQDRFLIAWRGHTPGTSWTAPPPLMDLVTTTGRLQVRAGSTRSPLGGVQLTLDDRFVSMLRLMPLLNGDFAIVWISVASGAEQGDARLHIRTYSAIGEPPIYDETRMVLPDSPVELGPSVFTWPDGTFAVPMTDIVPFQERGVVVRRYNRNGPIGETMELPPLRDRQAYLGVPSGDILSAWWAPGAFPEQRAEFHGRWFDSLGVPLTEEFLLTTETYRAQNYSSGPLLVNMPDGRVLAAWAAHPIYQNGQHVRLLALEAGQEPDSEPVSMLGSPSGDQDVLGLSVHETDLTVIWAGGREYDGIESVHATKVGLPDLASGASFTVRAPTSGFIKGVATAALADGMSVAVWSYRANVWETDTDELRLAFLPMEAR